MISFKQFLTEMPWFATHSDKLYIDDGPDYDINPHPTGWATAELHRHMDVAKKISNYDDDHHLYRYKSKHSGNMVYSLYNHKKDMVTMKISGPQYGNSFKTKNLESHSKRTTKAVDLYKHLLHNHKLTLVSGAEHTKGSRDLWENCTKTLKLR